MSQELQFQTRFGVCTIGWNENGISRFKLPDEAGRSDIEAMEAPREVLKVVDLATRHLGGDLQDFTSVALDWSLVSDFQQEVYRETAAIPPGETKSYGEIARLLQLGSNAARAVGVALGGNPWPLIIPCHRVIAANGKMTGFSAPGGIQTKTRLLALEGAVLLSE